MPTPFVFQTFGRSQEATPFHKPWARKHEMREILPESYAKDPPTSSKRPPNVSVPSKDPIPQNARTENPRENVKYSFTGPWVESKLDGENSASVSEGQCSVNGPFVLGSAWQTAEQDASEETQDSEHFLALHQPPRSQYRSQVQIGRKQVMGMRRLKGGGEKVSRQERVAGIVEVVVGVGCVALGSIVVFAKLKTGRWWPLEGCWQWLLDAGEGLGR